MLMVFFSDMDEHDDVGGREEERGLSSAGEWEGEEVEGDIGEDGLSSSSTSAMGDDGREPWLDDEVGRDGKDDDDEEEEAAYRCFDSRSHSSRSMSLSACAGEWSDPLLLLSPPPCLHSVVPSSTSPLKSAEVGRE